MSGELENFVVQVGATGLRVDAHIVSRGVPLTLANLVMDYRLRSALQKRGHIHTVAQLCAATSERLLELRDIGPKKLAKIRAALAAHGLSLSDDVTNGETT